MRMWVLKGFVVGIVCVAGVVLLLGLVGGESVVPLPNGRTIQVKTASFLGSLLWSTCDIKYQPRIGQSGVISLTESWTDYPVLLITKDDGKVLLCLFQLEDMCCQLVKFDTTKRFEPLHLHGHLDEIVRNSPWKVEVGNLDDFRYLCDLSKNLPPNELEKNAVPFPGYGIPFLSESRPHVNKSDIVFDLNGVAANWNSLHQ